MKCSKIHRKNRASLCSLRIEVFGKSCYNDINKGQGKAPKTRKGKAMTIHEKKSGTEYFERARKIAAAVIREIADRTHADGNATEAENNATMATLTTCLDGTQPQ